MTVFDIEVAKRFKDLDPYDHVSNATFLDYVMEARVRVYRAPTSARRYTCCADRTFPRSSKKRA